MNFLLFAFPKAKTQNIHCREDKKSSKNLLSGMLFLPFFFSLRFLFLSVILTVIYCYRLTLLHIIWDISGTDSHLKTLFCLSFTRRRLKQNHAHKLFGQNFLSQINQKLSHNLFYFYLREAFSSTSLEMLLWP